MTTETSNARGETYTFDMIEDAWGDAVPLTKPYFNRFRARLETLRQSAAPPPAAAEPKTLPVPTRVHLIGETAVIVGTPQRGWDEEGPDAHNCDDMGCSTIGPHVLARVPFTDERALTAAQQQGQAVAWMTPESIAHLAKQSGPAKVDAWNCSSGTERVPVYPQPMQQGGGEVWQPMATAPTNGAGILALLPDSNFPVGVRYHDGGWHVAWDGSRLGEFDQPRKWMRIPDEYERTAPPSAPVGVDAPGSRAWMAEVCRAAALSLAAHGVRNDQLSKVADWITQQPAAVAVDEAMVERATTAYLQSRGTYEGEVPVDRDDMRAALTAALAAPQQPAAVDGAMVVLTELVATLAATGTVTGSRIYFPERQTRELLKKACDALAAQHQEPKP